MAKASTIMEIRTFEKDIAAWCAFVEDGVKEITEITITKAANDIIDLSPVDTGRYYSNWQVSANSIPTFSIGVLEKSKDYAKTSLSRQIKAVVNSDSTRRVWISNVLPYANRLEYGHSSQAPNGVLGVVEARLGRYFSEAVDEVKK